MNKRRVVFIACLFFIFGVGIASIFFEHLSAYHFTVFVLFALSLIVSFYFYSTLSANGRKKVFIALLWSAFLFLGIWRVFISIPENTPDKIWYYNDNEISFVGKIVKEPDVRSSNQKITMSVIARSGATKPAYRTGRQSRGSKSNEIASSFATLAPRNDMDVSGKVLVTTGVWPEYEHGDVLEIKCKLKAPEKFDDFAYDKYLARYDIYSVCGFAKIEKIDEEGSFYKNIYRFKKRIGEVINTSLSEPEASLANAMVLGYKRGIDDDLRDSFSKVGLSHIMAISGMHISIIVAILFGFLLNLGLKRKYIFYLISLFLIFYVVLIGMPASAVRASLMGFLVLLAMQVGRLNKLDYALVLVASLLLIINPKQLIADIGFQLSFLAVLGIVYFYPIFESFYGRFENTLLSSNPLLSPLQKGGLKGVKIVWGILAVTLSAQIFTLPIIVYNFKIISFVSPLSNLLVLWTLPFVLMSIFIAVPLSMVFPQLSVLFFLPASIFLKYIVFVSDFLVKIPFSYFIF